MKCVIDHAIILIAHSAIVIWVVH